MSIAGVVLAAGASTRFGAPKQLVADAQGETLVHRAARLALEAGCTPVYVVVGADHERVAAAVADLPVQPVINAEWSEGIASSIRAAVSAAERHQQGTGELRGDRQGVDVPAAATGFSSTAIDALLLSACDMPTVNAAHLRALCTAYTGGAACVASRYATGPGQETIGIPAVIGAHDWPALAALQGDRGAKSLLEHRDTAIVWLPGGSFDVDTPEDLGAWRGS